MSFKLSSPNQELSPGSQGCLTYLVIFELPYPVLFFLLSLGLDGVWPLADSGVRGLLKGLSLSLAHAHIILLGVGLTAHGLDSFELVV